MWDLLFIDESQDWPETERDLLYKFYSHHNLVIADGVDQLVRSNDPINWREGIKNSDSQVVRLHKCMRTKYQLCKAINTIASLLNIEDWDLEPMPEVDGGKLYVVTGDGMSESLHKKLLSTSQVDGNKPIDFLYCVPPIWVEKQAKEERQDCQVNTINGASKLGTVLEQIQEIASRLVQKNLELCSTIHVGA